jgi:hypothetical protein
MAGGEGVESKGPGALLRSVIKSLSQPCRPFEIELDGNGGVSPRPSSLAEFQQKGSGLISPLPTKVESGHPTK